MMAAAGPSKVDIRQWVAKNTEREGTRMRKPTPWNALKLISVEWETPAKLQKHKLTTEAFAGIRPDCLCLRQRLTYAS